MFHCLTSEFVAERCKGRRDVFTFAMLMCIFVEDTRAIQALHFYRINIANFHSQFLKIDLIEERERERERDVYKKDIQNIYKKDELLKLRVNRYYYISMKLGNQC